MRLRPGFLYSVLTVVLALLTAATVRLTATESTTFVTQLMGFALLVVIVSLVLDLPQTLAASTIVVLGPVLIEAGFNDDPSWIRSLVIGCMWFVTVETGWEALERRDGSRRSTASLFRRVQDVSIVVAVALVVGIVAAVLISFAPARSVLLQAVMLALVIGSFVSLLRRVVYTSTDKSG